MFAGIVSALQGAECLSEQCREMLVSMAAPSLSAPKASRHSVQHLGVTMIEEVLQEGRKQLELALEEAQKELTAIESTKGSLEQMLTTARDVLTAKQGLATTAAAALEDAKAAASTAEAALAEQLELSRQATVAHSTLEKEHAELQEVYEKHFKAPMNANEGPHHEFLEPFLEHLGLEDSLTSALPCSCQKAKEQRGGFDDLVLTELGKALVNKISSLEKVVAEAATKMQELTVAVGSAQTELDARKVSQNAAQSSLEAASAVQTEAETQVSQAENDWSSFEPRLNAATDKVHQQDAKRLDFVEGALKEFQALRDKDVEQEAATMGA